MSIHAKKAQVDTSRTSPSSVTRNQHAGKHAFQFLDNRPESVAQQKLQEIAHNSQQAEAVGQLQAMADAYSSRQFPPIQRKENGTGLPDSLKSGIENLSGYSMDDVKVNYNSNKPEQLQAHAYAKGSDIYIGSAQEKHLPHEAWHVVQQKQGRVTPTMQIKGDVNVNDDPGLEKEADVMGEKALKHNCNRSEKQLHTSSKSTTIQPTWKFLGRVFALTKKTAFPGLSPGSGRYPIPWLPFFKLKHRFSGYEISGSFDAQPGKHSLVWIKYIEKTAESKGFDKLLADIERSASEVGSTGVDVTVEECKPAVVEKLEKYSKARKWNIGILDEGNGATGPTLSLSKKVTPIVEEKKESD